MRNPLTNGKIVAANYDQREYLKQSVPRGNPAYVMSRSDLVEFAKCPSKWLRSGRNADDATDSTEWGSLIDCLLMEPERFDERFAVYPSTYPAPESAKKDAPIVDKPWNNNATYCKEWKAERAGKTFFTAENMEYAAAAIARLKEDESIARILASSKFQVYATAEYHDRKTGVVVPLKVLIDILPSAPDAILDLKTARDAAPRRWPDVVASHHYHVQGALILDVHDAATKERREIFRHIVQENEPPFEVAKHELTPDFIEQGREFYVEALKIYAQCLKTGRWPGYESRECFGGWNLISPRAYMLNDSPAADPGWLSDEEKQAA